MRTDRFLKSAPNSTSSISGPMQAGPTMRDIRTCIISSGSSGFRCRSRQPAARRNERVEMVIVLYAPNIGVTRLRYAIQWLRFFSTSPVRRRAAASGLPKTFSSSMPAKIGRAHV